MSTLTDADSRKSGRGRITVSLATGRTFVALALIVFALFFLIPIVWLLFATTKSEQQLVGSNPFSLGSFQGLAAIGTRWSDFRAERSPPGSATPLSTRLPHWCSR